MKVLEGVEETGKQTPNGAKRSDKMWFKECLGDSNRGLFTMHKGNSFWSSNEARNPLEFANSRAYVRLLILMVPPSQTGFRVSLLADLSKITLKRCGKV